MSGWYHVNESIIVAAPHAAIADIEGVLRSPRPSMNNLCIIERRPVHVIPVYNSITCIIIDIAIAIITFNCKMASKKMFGVVLWNNTKIQVQIYPKC